jgi:hypothetical protein
MVKRWVYGCLGSLPCFARAASETAARTAVEQGAQETLCDFGRISVTILYASALDRWTGNLKLSPFCITRPLWRPMKRKGGTR